MANYIQLSGNTSTDLGAAAIYMNTGQSPYITVTVLDKNYNILNSDDIRASIIVPHNNYLICVGLTTNADSSTYRDRITLRDRDFNIIWDTVVNMRNIEDIKVYDGGIYVCGWTNVLYPGGNKTETVAKYNFKGEKMWGMTTPPLHGRADSGVFDMVVNQYGVYFFTTTSPNNSQTCTIKKYSHNGVFIKSINVGNSSNVNQWYNRSYYVLNTDSDGNIWYNKGVLGYSPAGGELYKYDSDLEEIWSSTFDYMGYLAGITMTSKPRVFCSGTDIYLFPTIFSRVGSASVMAKFNGSGEFVWNRTNNKFIGTGSLTPYIINKKDDKIYMTIQNGNTRNPDNIDLIVVTDNGTSATMIGKTIGTEGSYSSFIDFRQK